MEVFGLDMMVDCIVMMERPSLTLRVKRVSNNGIAVNLKMNCASGGTFSGSDKWGRFLPVDFYFRFKT